MPGTWGHSICRPAAGCADQGQRRSRLSSVSQALKVFAQLEGGHPFVGPGVGDGFSWDACFHRVPGMAAACAFPPANDGVASIVPAHRGADEVAVAFGAVHGGLGAEVMGHRNDQSTGVLVVKQLVAGSCLPAEAVLQDP